MKIVPWNEIIKSSEQIKQQKDQQAAQAEKTSAPFNRMKADNALPEQVHEEPGMGAGYTALSTIDRLAQTGLKALPFGEKAIAPILDTMAAGINALSPNKTYQQAKQDIQSNRAALSQSLEEEHPNINRGAELVGSVAGSLPLLLAATPAGAALSNVVKAKGLGKIGQAVAQHGGTFGAFEGLNALTHPNQVSDYIDPSFYLNALKKTGEGLVTGGVAGPLGEGVSAVTKVALPTAAGHYLGNALGGITMGTGFAAGGNLLEGRPVTEGMAENAGLMAIMNTLLGGKYVPRLPEIKPSIPTIDPVQEFKTEIFEKRPPMISRQGEKPQILGPAQEMSWDTNQRPPMISLEGPKPNNNQISLQGPKPNTNQLPPGTTPELLPGEAYKRPPMISLQGPKPKALPEPDAFSKMLTDVRPDVEAEIAKTYAPGHQPSPQQLERFVRDAALARGYDYDALATQAGIKPAEPQKMIKVEGKKRGQWGTVQETSRSPMKKAESEKYAIGQKLNTRPYGEVEVAEVGEMLIKLKTKSGETRSVSKRAIKGILAKEQSKAVAFEENAMPKAEIITDAARVQEIKNSIAEGELILRTGKINGRKMSADELGAVRRSVDSARAKISENPATNTSQSKPEYGILPQKDGVPQMVKEITSDYKVKTEGWFGNWESNPKVKEIIKEIKDSTDKRKIARKLFEPLFVDRFYEEGKIPAVGVRYGDAPANERSFNTMSNSYETGVSMVQVNDLPGVNSFAVSGAKHRKLKYYYGNAITKLGGDNEILMQDLAPITKEQYESFVNSTEGKISTYAISFWKTDKMAQIGIPSMYPELYDKWNKVYEAKEQELANYLQFGEQNIKKQATSTKPVEVEKKIRADLPGNDKIKENPKEYGEPYGKEGEVKGDNDVPAAEQPGVDNAAQLGQTTQAGAKGVTVKKGIGQKVAEIRALAKSGKLTMDEAHKFNASNDITDPTKRLIINDVNEAMKKGLHLPDSQVSFEQWHYRKYGQEPPSDRAFLYDQNYLKKEQRKYDAFIKKAKNAEKFDQKEAEIKKSIRRKSARLNSNPADIWADYVKYGALKVHKGFVEFETWAEEMIKDLGTVIKPHLKRLWADTQKYYGENHTKAQPKVESKTESPSSNIGDADSFRAKINREAKAKRTPFRETIEQIRTQFVDAVAPFEKAEKAVRGKVSSAEDSFYKTARSFKGTPEKAHEIIRTELNPIIEGVEKAGHSYEDLGDYALAVHAKDVNVRGREMVAVAEARLQEGIGFNETVKDMIKTGEAVKGQYALADIAKLKEELETAKRFRSGFTDAEIDAVIAKYGKTEIESARKKLIKLSNNLLDDLADAGRISVDDVKAMKKKWPNYMPLFRSFDDAKIEFGKGLSNSFANVTNPINKLEGSSRDVIDPIENMIKNIFKITNVAERTKVGKQLLKLADEDVAGEVARRLEPGEEVGRKNVLNLYENGQKVQVEVQPDVYKAMLDMDKESSLLLIDLLSKPASVLRAGATLTPEFSVRNPMRDVVNAFVVSESGFNPVIDFPVGLANAIFKGRKIKIMGKELNMPGDMYHQFLMDNGGYGNIVSMDRKVHREALESALKKPVGKKFVNIINPKSWLEVLRAISDATETATKVGEYRAALRSGATRQEAAYRARDLMDFARSGTSIKQANRIIAFLNANIQGKSKLIRAIKENPTGVLTRAMVAVVLPTVGAYVAQKTLANDTQQETIEDAPDWLRDTFWLVPIPGTNQVARIPKPFDLAPIFSNSVERFLDYAVDKEPEAFDGFIKRAIGSFSVPVMLTGLIPFVEGMANYSFFRQGTVIPQREQGLQYKDQKDINTTETAKLLAAGAEKLTGGEGPFKNFSSPRVMDNTLLGATAGLGKIGTSIIDTFLEGIGAVEKPEKPTKSVSQLPILKAFLVNENASGESVDKLYKERERLTDAKNSAKLNRKPFRENGRLKMVESATKRIGAISKRIRQVENSPSMSSEEKGRLIKKLSADRNRLARDFMDKLQK